MASSQASSIRFSNEEFTRVLKNFNRTPESFEEDIQLIKNWMKTQHHLPEILSNNQIRCFLILNKCSTEVVKQKIDMYYTIRSLIPEMFENISLHSPHMKIIYCVSLPELHEDLNRVSIFKFRNPALMDQLDAMKLFSHILHLVEIRLEEDYSLQDIFIVDLEHASFSFLNKFTLPLLAKVFFVYEKVFSMRLAGIYLINTPTFVKQLVAILKILMKPKIFERVHLCKDATILQELLTSRDLPKEYGGDGCSLQERQDIIKLALMTKYKERWINLEKLRINENLRPQKLENDHILGFYGNFKQLRID